MFSERSERQKGFTLFEIAVALAIVGIMAAAFTATASTIRTSQLTAIVRQVNSIREASDKYIEATGAINYTSLNTAGITTLINAGYLPSSISSSSNPLGVTYASAAGSTNTQLVITISNLPDWARTSVANRLGNYGSASVLGDGTVQVVF